MRNAAHSRNTECDTLNDNGPDATLHAIRSVLESDAQPEPAKTSPVRIAEEEPPVTATVSPNAETNLKPAATSHTSVVRRLFSRITRRHVIWAGILAVIVFKPHWVFLALCLVLFVTLGAALMFGSDRLWSAALTAFARLKARHPAKAARAAQRLDRFAMWWDGVLDRFPEGSVDALYFPDLQAIAQRDAAHEVAMDNRLRRMREEGQEA